MCCGCDTFYIVSVNIQCQASIFTLSLCRGHSWRVRLAKQGTLTPPGHLVSPLICRGPWMSTVVLYCWCHGDSASVHLYFTLNKSLLNMLQSYCSSTHVTLHFVIITHFVIHYKLRWISTQFVIHRISNWVTRATLFVIYYNMRQHFII